MVTDAQKRQDFENAYRKKMANITTEHQKARRLGQGTADADLGELGRSLTAAFELWKQGGTLTPQATTTLESYVGPIPPAPAPPAQPQNRGT